MIYNLYLPLLVSFYMAFNPNKLVSMNYNLYLPLLVSFYMAFNPNKLLWKEENERLNDSQQSTFLKGNQQQHTLIPLEPIITA